MPLELREERLCAALRVLLPAPRGDLTPSRACRLRPPDSFLQEEVCDPDVSGERGTFEKVAQHIAVRAESGRSTSY